MKTLLRIIVLFALGMLAGAAFAQTKGPATVTVTAASTANGVLTWTAPAAVSGGWAGCGSPSTCTYQVYVLPATCPSPLIGSTGWATIGSPVSGTTFTDGVEAGGSTESYYVVTLQGGMQSGPSNCITLTFPFAPGDPTGTTGTTSPS